MIFHVDANSFYASCEGLFRPDLRGKPIAVLSNNDGIIIALNAECKEAGFARGDAYYQKKDEMARSGVTVFSSNYTLYADISARLNMLYFRYTPDVEIYSIDESFLYFPSWDKKSLAETGSSLRERVGIEVGIPISVGIAPTKTLAKLCNKLAKKRGGVCAWAELDGDAELAHYPVGDLWGVGRSKTKLLARHGVDTALDLKRFPLHRAKECLSITGMRTVQELNEVPAIDRVERERHQNICSSKSFSRAVYDLDEIKTALSDYAQEAVKRMRAERSACRAVAVFLSTNPASETGEYYGNSATAELGEPTSFLPDIQGTALRLLEGIYRPGFRYRKVLINLIGLESEVRAQGELFVDDGTRQRNDALMTACDRINDRYGRGTIGPGSRRLVAATDRDGNRSAWVMKRDFLSPEYTTKLADVPRVR